MPNDTLLTDTAPQPVDTASPPTDSPVASLESTPVDAQKAASATEDAEKPLGAPEKYEFAAPEGQQYDSQIIGAYSEVARELGMTQDAAQKLLDKVAPALASRQAEQIEAIRTGWADSARADKEFGGGKLTENLAVAQRALTAFGSDELRGLLKDSGLGNHPEVIRLLYRAGKAISPDNFVTGSKAASTEMTAAKRLYPDLA